MTASAPSLAQPETDQQTLRELLLLVLGHHGSASADWTSLYELAAAERVAGLAWVRSGELIRANAPPSVIERWRSIAMRIALQVETLMEVVADAVGALRRAGVEVVVLKGAPLSQRLYGDIAARPLADCDVFVPLADRAQACEALSRGGWTSRVGEPPSEETFERWARGQRNVIEVHSSLIDDALLAHIEIPIECVEVQIGSLSIAAQSGDYLPGFLAAHLAKHETAPLLWIVDFHTLWTSLDETCRARARDRARKIGLGRHLDWACALAACVPRGASGDPDALASLSGLRRATGDLGRVRRLIALSANPVAALHVVTGRVWPEEWRDGWMNVPNYMLRRVAGWIARKLKLVDRRPATVATRGIAVDDGELGMLLNETIGRGLSVWIRPRGTSMEPAIPSSAAARIVPASARGLREDDIVLARLPHGQLVLHRVRRLWDDKVQLKGDAMRRRDDVVERSAILGLCDSVEVDGVMYRAEDRPRDSVALLTSTARTRLRRLVTQRDA